MATPKMGLQLYSVRKLAKRDFIGTFAKIAQMGYQVVAFAGYHGQDYRVLRQALEANGLEAVASFIAVNWENPSDRLKELKKEFEYASQLGMQYVVVPSAPWPDQPKLEDVQYVTSVLRQVGEQARQAGLTLGFHPHETEYRIFGGVRILDHLLNQLPVDLMMLILDVGAIHLAGCKTEEELKRYAGRVPFLHMKDYKEGRKDTIIGQGVIDFAPVLPAIEEAGMPYVIVEQEQPGSDPLADVRQSLVFFAARGWAPMPPPAEQGGNGQQQQGQAGQAGQGTGGGQQQGQAGQGAGGGQQQGQSGQGTGGEQQQGQAGHGTGDGQQQGQAAQGQTQTAGQGSSADGSAGQSGASGGAGTPQMASPGTGSDSSAEQVPGGGAGSGAQDSGTGEGGSGTGSGQSG